MNTARRSNRSQGQSLAEFALVLPIFFLLVFGVIDAGRAIFAFNQMSQASRNVARVASVTCFRTTSTCDASTAGSPIAVALSAQAAGQQGAVTWSVTCVDPATDTTATTCALGDLVRVRASSQFQLFTPFVAQAFGPVNVQSTSEAQIIQ
jgi:Flp pilus assembly protein TadG